MAQVETAQPTIARHPTEDPKPRSEVVGGSVNADEKARVLAALEQAGFRNQSEGMRALALTFVSSAEVRDAVSRALKAA